MSAARQPGIADARIELESPDQPDVLALIEDLDAYQKPLYPIESFHGIDLEALSRPDVLFAVARGAPVGSTVIGISTPFHRGRTTQVWQTLVSTEDGKLCAVVTQTQLVIPASPA